MEVEGGDETESVIDVNSNEEVDILISNIDTSEYDAYVKLLEQKVIDEFNLHFDFENNNNENTSDTVTENDSNDSNTEDNVYEEWGNKLSEDDIIEIENIVHENIEEYIQNEIHNLLQPTFHENMISDITELIYPYLEECGLCSNDMIEELENKVGHIISEFFTNCTSIYPRSHPTSFTYTTTLSDEVKESLTNTIHRLKNVYQPAQKTEEWYRLRSNIITASNIWKVFGSEFYVNSLIYEKCKPYEVGNSTFRNDNITSPLHWGVKYEPVSIMFYERTYNTKVSEFGCIIHPAYPFIGASPDGINTDITNPRYGRMLEIKNIVNREINGIPKLEYWVQMQLQMETCVLNECDFLETRFKEFDNKEEFYSDSSVNLYGNNRGVIIAFLPIITDLTVPNDTTPYYVYMPLDLPLERSAIDEWIEEKTVLLEGKYAVFNIYYWYLDEWSCVLVNRHTDWFSWAIPKIKECWDTIERERKTGYEHRMAKKKPPKPVVIIDNTTNTHHIKNMPFSGGICLVKIDETSFG